MGAAAAAAAAAARANTLDVAVARRRIAPYMPRRTQRPLQVEHSLDDHPSLVEPALLAFDSAHHSRIARKKSLQSNPRHSSSEAMPQQLAH